MSLRSGIALHLRTVIIGEVLGSIPGFRLFVSSAKGEMRWEMGAKAKDETSVTRTRVVRISQWKSNIITPILLFLVVKSTANAETV